MSLLEACATLVSRLRSYVQGTIYRSQEDDLQGVFVIPGFRVKEQLMSQQEFEPGSQSEQDSLNEDDEIQYPQYPYSWSGKPHQGRVPRDEPPFSYDTTMMEQEYKAQSSGNPNATPSSQPKVEGRYEYVAPEGDGDAYEQGYRPYNTYNATRSRQSVPPWARPQRHHRNPMRFGFILLILIGIGLLNAVFTSSGFFGDIFGTIIGVLFFVIIVPLIMIFVLLGIVLRMFRPRRTRYWRRGPWWL